MQAETCVGLTVRHVHALERGLIDMECVASRVVAALRLAAAVCLLSAGVLQAQVPTGSLTGLVTDPKDGVVTGAHVPRFNAAQGLSSTPVTTSSGLFVL